MREEVNAISRLEYMLDYESNKVYTLLINSEKVKNESIKPSLEQFRDYCEKFKRGLEYSLETYGSLSIPRGLEFADSITLQDGTYYDMIGYLPEIDSIAITMLRIANEARWYGVNGMSFFVSRLGSNGLWVKPQTNTILVAIEEAYHRYQFHKLGYNYESSTHNDRMHPMELEIKDVFEKARKDLSSELEIYD